MMLSRFKSRIIFIFLYDVIYWHTPFFEDIVTNIINTGDLEDYFPMTNYSLSMDAQATIERE